MALILLANFNKSRNFTLSLQLIHGIGVLPSSYSLIKKELYFVGIDIIGDYITEINVTSPTGIREIKNLDSIAIEEMFWDFIENKLEI